MPRFKPRDIVVSGPPYRPALFVITEVVLNRPKNCYNAVCPVKGGRYKLGDESLTKIGEATEDFMKGGNPNADEDDSIAGSAINYERGKKHAEDQAQFGMEHEKSRWALLASKKPGDFIDAKIRGSKDRLKFHYVLTRGHKYVFLATNSNGTTYKYPLSCILIDGQTMVMTAGRFGGRSLEEML